MMEPAVGENTHFSFADDGDELGQEAMLDAYNNHDVNKGDDCAQDRGDTPPIHSKAHADVVVHSNTNSMKRVRDPRAPEPEADDPLMEPDFGDLSPEEMTEYRYESPTDVRHDYVEVDVHHRQRVHTPPPSPNRPLDSPPPTPTKRPAEVRFCAEDPDSGGPSPSTPTRPAPVREITANQRAPQVADDNCCTRCLRCLARVPCATLSVWVFMVMSVSACAGAIMIGTEKTRQILDKEEDFLNLTHVVCIGVIFGMLFLGTIFLLVAVVSSGKTSKRIFNTTTKNICARVINGFTICFMVLVQFIWICVVSALTWPVALLVLLQVQRKIFDVECIDLQSYAVSLDSKKYCNQDLDWLVFRSKDVLIAFGAAYITAIFAVLSMTYFILCAAANFVYLKESRFVTYDVYRNDIGPTHDSVNGMQDTKM